MISGINHAFSEMERIRLQESDALSFADSLDVIQSQQTLKTKFDSRVKKWLERKSSTRKSVDKMLGLSQTLRPRGTSVKSISTSAKFISSSRSVYHSVKSNISSKASSRIKIDTARLRLKEFEEKHELEKQEVALKRRHLKEENECIVEKNDLKHKFKMLRASQRLDEAILERQMMEKEMERAGYITPEEIPDSSSESEQVVHDLLSGINITDVNAAVLGVPPTSNLVVSNAEVDKPSVLN